MDIQSLCKSLVDCVDSNPSQFTQLILTVGKEDYLSVFEELRNPNYWTYHNTIYNSILAISYNTNNIELLTHLIDDSMRRLPRIKHYGVHREYIEKSIKEGNSQFLIQLLRDKRSNKDLISLADKLAILMENQLVLQLVIEYLSANDLLILLLKAKAWGVLFSIEFLDAKYVLDNWLAGEMGYPSDISMSTAKRVSLGLPTISNNIASNFLHIYKDDSKGHINYIIDHLRRINAPHRYQEYAASLLH